MFGLRETKDRETIVEAGESADAIQHAFHRLNIGKLIVKV